MTTLRIFINTPLRHDYDTTSSSIWFQTGPERGDGTYVGLNIATVEPSGWSMESLEVSEERMEITPEELTTALTILRDLKLKKEV